MRYLADTCCMTTGSRGLRETVVRALAKVGLVWAVVVLGALFVTMSAQAQDGDTGSAGSSTGTHARDALPSGSSGDGPSTAGVAFALVVLGAGVTVLALGASRGGRGDRLAQRKYAGQPEPASDPASEPAPEPASDLPLALGLGLMA